MDQCRETAVRSTDWPSCYWKSKLGRCGLWSFINHFRLCGETPQVWPRQPTRSTRQLGCERFRTTNLCKLSLIWFCSQNGRVWCALLKCERVICQAESSDVMDKMAPRTSNLVLNLYAWCAYLALVSDAENQFWLGFTKSSRKWDRIRQVAPGFQKAAHLWWARPCVACSYWQTHFNSPNCGSTGFRSISHCFSPFSGYSWKTPNGGSKIAVLGQFFNPLNRFWSQSTIHDSIPLKTCSLFAFEFESWRYLVCAWIGTMVD